MSSISTFADLPKPFKPGGQMWNDPRVRNHWEAVRRVKRMADAAGKAITEEQMVACLCGIMDGVPYTTELDQEREERMDYAPITSSGEFWIVRQAQRDAESFEDRPRTDWPEWADFQELEDVFLEGLDDEPLNEDEDDLHEYIPGTSPWQEHIDNQRSKMVADMSRAAEKGKKWAKHPALMVVALQALDNGESFQRARELGFLAYHASFVGNIGKVRAKGLVIACTDFSTGKRTTVYKLLPWRYLRLAMPYLHPAAQRVINQRVDEISIFLAEEQERRQRLINEFIAKSKKRLAACRA